MKIITNRIERLEAKTSPPPLSQDERQALILRHFLYILWIMNERSREEFFEQVRNYPSKNESVEAWNAAYRGASDGQFAALFPVETENQRDAYFLRAIASHMITEEPPVLQPAWCRLKDLSADVDVQTAADAGFPAKAWQDLMALVATVDTETEQRIRAELN